MTMTRSVDGICIKMAVLAGAAADTNIAVTDIATEDIIIGCLHFSTAAAIATVADITGEVVILSAGNVQLTDTDTTSDQLVLFWADRSV